MSALDSAHLVRFGDDHAILAGAVDIPDDAEIPVNLDAGAERTAAPPSPRFSRRGNCTKRKSWKNTM